MTIKFFHNGNTMCFNDNGQQIPEYQKSWVLAFIDSIRDDIDEQDLLDADIELPSGQKIKLVITEDGEFNFSIIKI